MVYVVYRGDGMLEKGTILFKIDAWQKNSIEKARQYIYEGAWICTEQQITMNGDMVLWVE